jgi:cyclohexadieny/prephenate dehydrogenase
MAEVSVAVLGLGRIGASICLALKRYNARPGSANKFNVTAYAPAAARVKYAKDNALAERTAQYASDAVRGADIVVMALPLGETEGAYNLIGQDVRSGAVVLDFSTVKREANAYAQKTLNPEAHFIGVTPIVNPRYLFDALDEPEFAAEDLFDHAPTFIMAGTKAPAAALDLGADFAAVLGAQPQFTDIAENDVLMAISETFPKVVGAMVYVLLSRTRGWDDSQRMTNAAFGTTTNVFMNQHPDDLTAEVLHNKDTLVRYLDEFSGALRSMRDLIAEGDRDGVTETFGRASAEYERWINRRNNNRWDDDRAIEAPEAPGIMTTLFGGYMASRLRGKKDGK